MLASKRRFEPSVIQRLLDEPFRFGFFQAIRMLELWLKQNHVPLETAVADYLRFQNRTSLDFPASELEALFPYPALKPQTAEELLAALRNGELGHISLTPTFMGFLGGNGALPAHYTERIAEHSILNRNDGPRAFLDTFSNRALALFYQAWRKYRLELKYELDGRDRFLPLLLSLAGVGQKSLQNRHNFEEEGILDQSLGYYATALRQRPASASFIARMLSEYFAVAIRVDQFIGHWYEVPQNQKTQLGANNATLGSEAMIGSRVWQRDLRVRLLVGPLDRVGFERFLPGGRAALALKKMLTLFTNLSLEYEVQLILRRQDVQRMHFDAASLSGRLGWDTFLMTKEAETDRADVRYEIHAL